MLRPKVCAASALFLVFALSTAGKAQSRAVRLQEATAQPKRDASGLKMCADALDISGGINSIKGVKDIMGTGEITFFFLPPVTAQVTIKERGTSAFRLDAILPDGSLLWNRLDDKGKKKQPDGTITEIPYHNAVMLGSYLIPFNRCVSALDDPTVQVVDDGVQMINGHQVEHVKFMHGIGAKAEDEQFLQLQDFSIYFDPTTHAITTFQNKTHPIQSASVDSEHVVYFSDYRKVRSVMVPFSVTEWVGGQKIWSLQLNSVELNNGLTDSDFQF